MSASLATIITIIVCHMGTVLGLTFRYQRKIACMTGMMIAMTIGMTIGLMAGIILGIYYQGNLFYSTFISMGIGLLIGFVGGLPVSIMAIIEGMLSGAMGGMMGAMLGEMIHPNFQDSTIKVMFVFSLCILLFLIYMLIEEVNYLKGKRAAHLFQNPLFIIPILIIFFYGFNQLGPVFTEHQPLIENIDHHKN